MVEHALTGGHRAAGVLLHPAALGPGALGAPAHEFVDWLAAAGFRVWQMLPLGPVGSDGSPYWVRSDCAGNAALLPAASPANDHGLERFRTDNSDWLSDYALYEALATRHGLSWADWPPELRDRDTDRLTNARVLLAPEIRAVELQQLAFEQAWRSLRAHAHRHGIRLIGDLPMYVAPDAVDVWVHRREFVLDAQGRPALLAGVPPDYFSADGQLWGNPVYDWHYASANGFAHFRRRIRAALHRCDWLRIDHFRALAAHWVVAPGSGNARTGHWRDTPGADFLAAVRTDFPQLPFIAEDLGEITPDVHALRDQFALPGMHVMQFAFDGDPANLHLPGNFRANSVAYLGTHDNDTTPGWVLGLDSETLRRACARLGVAPGQLATAMRRELLKSRAALAVLTVPDLLDLGSEARYNTPGKPDGNWSWQLPKEALTGALARHLHGELAAAGRV